MQQCCFFPLSNLFSQVQRFSSAFLSLFLCLSAIFSLTCKLISMCISFFFSAEDIFWCAESSNRRICNEQKQERQRLLQSRCWGFNVHSSETIPESKTHRLRSTGNRLVSDLSIFFTIYVYFHTFSSPIHSQLTATRWYMGHILPACHWNIPENQQFFFTSPSVREKTEKDLHAACKFSNLLATLETR